MDMNMATLSIYNSGCYSGHRKEGRPEKWIDEASLHSSIGRLVET